MLVVTFSSTTPKLSSVDGRWLSRPLAFIARPLRRKVGHDVEPRLRRVMGHAREAPYVEVEHPPRAGQGQGGEHPLRVEPAIAAGRVGKAVRHGARSSIGAGSLRAKRRRENPARGSGNTPVAMRPRAWRPPFVQLWLLATPSACPASEGQRVRHRRAPGDGHSRAAVTLGDLRQRPVEVERVMVLSAIAVCILFMQATLVLVTGSAWSTMVWGAYLWAARL